MLAFHRFSHTVISSYYSSYNQKVPALFLQIKQEPQKNMEYFLTQQPQEKQALSEKIYIYQAEIGYLPPGNDGQAQKSQGHKRIMLFFHA